jgi:hypothetical protein
VEVKLRASPIAKRGGQAGGFNLARLRLRLEAKLLSIKRDSSSRCGCGMVWFPSLARPAYIRSRKITILAMILCWDLKV